MIDLVATVALSVLLLAAAGAALFTSPFLLMTTDSADENSDLKPLGRAYVFVWGAVAAGIVGAALGVYRAARHGGLMWIWPALGVAVIGAGFVAGGLLAVRAARKSS